jgi:sugar lactone lactonase YvrE
MQPDLAASRSYARTTPPSTAQGNLYLSDGDDWSDEVNGYVYKIPPGGGEAVRWFPRPVNTPHAIALDAEEGFLYFVETWGSAIARIAIACTASTIRAREACRCAVQHL